MIHQVHQVYRKSRRTLNEQDDSSECIKLLQSVQTDKCTQTQRVMTHQAYKQTRFTDVSLHVQPHEFKQANIRIQPTQRRPQTSLQPKG